MNLQVKWTDIALQSLSEVSDYTFIRFGERQLIKLSKRIKSTTRNISFFPQLGKKETDLYELCGVNYRSIVVIKEIKLYYTIVDNTIFVEYVKNTNMDDTTMLNRLNIL